jgi:hypothetical protein
MSGMSAPLGFGFGARYMTDQTMKFTGEGTVVAVRMQTTDYEFSDVADIGFSVSVSGRHYLDKLVTLTIQLFHNL